MRERRRSASARSTAGFKPGQERHPPEIVYTADIFDREALDFVVKHDIHVNCGSPDMIDQYGERAAGRRAASRSRGITLRINPGFGHGHSQKVNTGGSQSKHGIWHEQLEDCIERATKYKLSITGLHMHIGSGTDLEHLSQVCSAMEKAAITVGSSILSISAGGGLPVPYREGESFVDVAAYFKLWNATRHRLATAVRPRDFAGDRTGPLPRRRERLSDQRNPRDQDGRREHVLPARRRLQQSGPPDPLRRLPPDGNLPRRRQSRAAQRRRTRDVIVGGPLCESGDIFTQEAGGFVARRPLPEAKVGDFLSSATPAPTAT